VQLSTQNPLDPMKDAEMFAQIAQLGQVDGLGKLQTSVDMQQANSYLGKTVVAVRPDTKDSYKVDLLEGKVTKVLVRDGDPYLVVEEAKGGSVEIQLKHVQQVKN
jgi:flagellar hook assembly protein FlgD